MRTQSFNTLKTIVLAVFFSIGLSYAYAWTAPTVLPPGGNVSAPINTSSTNQTKTGALTVGGFNVSMADNYYTGVSITGENFHSSDPATRLRIQDKTGGISWFLSANNDGKFALHQGSVSDRIVVDNIDGSVGIGMSPVNKLTVSGNIGATGDICTALGGGKCLSAAGGGGGGAGMDPTPIGSIVSFAGATAPSGYLLCNGASVLRADYPSLFAVIGTTYGAVDATHFNLPDLRGEFVRGFDGGRGVDAGRTLGTAQADMLKSHTHTIMADGTLSALSPAFGPATGSNNTYSTNATGGTETRPRNVALNYIIKAIPGVSGEVSGLAAVLAPLKGKEISCTVAGFATYYARVDNLGALSTRLYSYDGSNSTWVDSGWITGRVSGLGPIRAQADSFGVIGLIPNDRLACSALWPAN